VIAICCNQNNHIATLWHQWHPPIHLFHQSFLTSDSETTNKSGRNKKEILKFSKLLLSDVITLLLSVRHRKCLLQVKVIENLPKNAQKCLKICPALIQKITFLSSNKRKCKLNYAISSLVVVCTNIIYKWLKNAKSISTKAKQ